MLTLYLYLKRAPTFLFSEYVALLTSSVSQATVDQAAVDQAAVDQAVSVDQDIASFR